MRSAFVSLVSVALFVGSAVAQSFMINTPSSAVECEPLMISWSGGTAPYFLRLVFPLSHLFHKFILLNSILPGNEPSAPPLVDLGQQTGTSVTWLVNLAPGTSLGLTIRDSNGAIAQSAAFTVLSGTVTSCIGQAPSSTPAATGATSPGGTPATTPAATTPAVSSTPTAPATSATPKPSTTGTGTTSRANGTGTTGAPASTSTRSSDSSRAAQIGLAAILGGAAVVALLG